MPTIQTKIECEIEFIVEGEYIPGVSDSSVGYEGDGEVNDVSVYLYNLNVTGHLTPGDLEWFKEQFLDYCEENIGD